MSGPTVLIMAGGTGGHVFPALAVADALRKSEFRVTWLGTRAGLEARLVPDAKIPIDWVSVGGLRGKRWGTWLLAPFKLALALAQSLLILLRRRPSVVLGMGGFVSGPGGLAAWLLRRPLVIHEQNAAAGLTNRWLARIASEVLQAFPGGFEPKLNARAVGNPVRPEIAALPEPGVRWQGRGAARRVLVIGGSQGALALNETLPLALAQLDADAALEIRHQAGARTQEVARKAYAAAAVAAQIVPFIDDMAGAYAWADLVVCRAGALTVAEIAAAGLPALFIPFPQAVDDHQTRNAHFLVDAGAARLIAQADATPDHVAATLRDLLGDREALLAMARAARAQAAPAATEMVAETCRAHARGGRR